MKVLVAIVILSIVTIEVKCQPGAPGNVSAEQIPGIIKQLNDNMHQLQNDKLTIVKLHNVRQQVVAGILYTISGIFVDDVGQLFTCKVLLWDRPWLAPPNNVVITLQSKTSIQRMSTLYNLIRNR